MAFGQETALPMDALSDILDLLQLRGTLYFRTAFAAPWAITVPAYRRAARFHIVAQGRCHVVVDGQAVALEAGDLVVIPNGAAHCICDTPDTPARPLDDVLARTGYAGSGVLVWSEDVPGAAETRLICGHLSFAEGAEHPLLRALPAFLHVTAELRAGQPWLDELVQLITRRMFAGAPGATAAVIRLSEALFIEVVRCCADQDAALRDLLTAIGDPRIGRALTLLHRRPDQVWSLDRLAREAGMSRSRLAARFQALLGCGPMGYLAEVRLQKAMNLLTGTGEPVQRVARCVGYSSAAAFSRAFAQRFGVTPREVRRTSH